MKTAFNAGHQFKCSNGHAYAEAAADIPSGTAPSAEFFKWIKTDTSKGLSCCAECGRDLPGWVTFAQMGMQHV